MVAAHHRLDVVICGAGLGGIAAAIAVQRAGHHAIVLEAAPELAEIGAGIQLTPNVTRILDAWGLGDEIKSTAVHPRTIWFRRWQDGSKIAKTALIPDFEEKFGAKYYVAHRAHLHDALHRKALALGAEVRVDCRVVNVDFDAPSVTLADGNIVLGDLVVGADGIKSITRAHLLRNLKDAPTRTSFCAYRALVATAKMRNDPDLEAILRNNELNVWIGPDVHCMSYPVANGEKFNLVLSHKDARDPADYPTGSRDVLADMRSYYVGWDPVLNRILDLVDTTSKWPLMTYPCLSTWSSASGKFVLLGDSCHAMLPYMSSGAAMAIEDGATLGRCLARAASLPAAISAYEDLRIPRAREVQQRSAENGRRWHFQDGPEQKARDRGSRAEVEGLPYETSTNQWSDPQVAQWLYGHDAEAVVDAYFASRANVSNGRSNGFH